MVSNVVFHLFSSVINRNVLRWHSSRQVSTVFRGVASNVEVFCMTTSNNRGGEDISVLWWWYTFSDRCGQIKEIFSSALPLSGVYLRSPCWESENPFPLLFLPFFFPVATSIVLVITTFLIFCDQCVFIALVITIAITAFVS